MLSNTVFTVFAFFSTILVFVPLPWHAKSYNVGTIMYMIWSGSSSLKFAIDSIIWNGNAINWAPVWCEIGTRIHIAANIGIPAASLVINRRLYYIANTTQVHTSKSERNRMMIVDLFISLGLGLVAIPLQFIVQGHRFDILEDVGCFPHTVNTPLAFLLVHVPPILIGLVSFGFCVGSFRAFNKRRTIFNELLRTHSTDMNPNKYWRLMGLATVEAITTVPLGIYILVMDITSNQVRPWISWESIHDGFGRIDQIPRMLWAIQEKSERNIEFSRWAFVMSGLIFFAFFGFTEEAMKNYKVWTLAICRPFGFEPAWASGKTTTTSGSRASNASSSRTGSATLPVFSQRQTTENKSKQKRDDLDSLFEDSDDDLEKKSICSSSQAGPSASGSSTNASTFSLNCQRQAPISAKSSSKESFNCADIELHDVGNTISSDERKTEDLRSYPPGLSEVPIPPLPQVPEPAHPSRN